MSMLDYNALECFFLSLKELFIDLTYSLTDAEMVDGRAHYTSRYKICVH